MGFVGFARKVWAEVSGDDVFTWGSALAYAWIFAIFPFLIFLLTLAPYLPGGAKERAMKQVESVAYSSVGGDAGNGFVKSVDEVMHNQKGGLLSIGLVLALWGASGGMAMTMSALDKAYYVHCTRSFIRQRAIAIGLTVGSAALILTVMLLLPVGSAIISYLAKRGHLGLLGTILIDVVRYALALALLFAIVALIYYFGPCIKQKWQSVTPGAVFTVAVWVALGFTFSTYVTHFGNFNKTYGALGAAIVMLLFFYINAVVLLIGAEVNSVIDFEVLNVKPGAADISRAKAKSRYDETHAGEPKATPHAGGGGGGGGAIEVVHLPIVPAEPESHVGRKVLVFGTSFLALRWAWLKFWGARAKRKRQEALARARRPWWRRWQLT